MEDELFKPTDGTKVGEVTAAAGSGDGGGGGSGESAVQPAGGAVRPSSWLSRAHHQRKLPEQTELYAQLRRMGHAGDSDGPRSFGDHDYCALSLGERRKRSAAMLGAMLQVNGGLDIRPPARATESRTPDVNGDGEERLPLSEAAVKQQPQQMVAVAAVDCQSLVATPPTSEEEEAAERSSASRSPSPVLHLCPDSPASKTDSRSVTSHSQLSWFEESTPWSERSEPAAE